MEWKSIGIVYWVRYIHIELIDYGSSPCEYDSVDNNKLLEKIKLPKESNEGNHKCILLVYMYVIINLFFSDKNNIILSNHPNKEQISEFITSCTSTAEENLLPNLFDWKSDSLWTSESSFGVVRQRFQL